MIPHVDDPPAIQALKVRIWNLRSYLNGELSRDNFEKASAELKAIWSAWAALE